MGRNVRWAVGMTAFGLVVAACVYAATGSVGWALVGLLIAGVAANIAAGSAARDRRP